MRWVSPVQHQSGSVHMIFAQSYRCIILDELSCPQIVCQTPKVEPCRLYIPCLQLNPRTTGRRDSLSSACIEANRLLLPCWPRPSHSLFPVCQEFLCIFPVRRPAEGMARLQQDCRQHVTSPCCIRCKQTSKCASPVLPEGIQHDRLVCRSARHILMAVGSQHSCILQVFKQQGSLPSLHRAGYG